MRLKYYLLASLMVQASFAYSQTGIIRSEFFISLYNSSFGLAQIDSAGGLNQLLDSSDTVQMTSALEFNTLQDVDSLLVEFSSGSDTGLVWTSGIPVPGEDTVLMIDGIEFGRTNNWLLIGFDSAAFDLPFEIKARCRLSDSTLTSVNSIYYE